MTPICVLQVVVFLSSGQPRVQAAETGSQPVRQIVLSGDAVILGNKKPTESFEIIVARLNTFQMAVSVDMSFFPVEGQHSLVPHGDRLFIANAYPAAPRGLAGGNWPDRMFCVSAVELSFARWVDVSPTGTIIKPILATPSAWSRGIEDEPRRIVHAAFCAGPGAKLYLFDARKPAEGKKLGTVLVTELTPTFDETAKDWGLPKQVVKETIPNLPFTESFHPYHIDGDFFFITQSGKVYSALKPEKDRPRALVDMKLPLVVRYAVDNGNGTYHLVGTSKDGQWRYAKLGREIADRPLNISDGFDKLKPIKAAVQIVQSIKQDATKK